MSNSKYTEELPSDLKRKIAILIGDCDNCIGGLIPSGLTSPYAPCPVCKGLGAKQNRVDAILELIQAEILKARIEDIKEYIGDYEDMERSRAPQAMYDRLAVLSNQTKEKS